MVDPTSPSSSPSTPCPTSSRSLWSSVGYTIALCSVAVVVSGTRACQEDYALGAQTKGVDPTAIPDVTTTPTETPETTATATPTASPTPTPVGTLTPVPAGSATPTPSPAPTSALLGILSEVKDASASRGSQDGSNPTADGRQGGADSGASVNPNWLGEAFVARIGTDTDGDGFTDEVENEYGSDSKDARRVPGYSCASLLRDRLAGIDDDADGLSVSDERRLGTNQAESDSDGDGCVDGAEVWSQSNPLDAQSLPMSEGGFCLSDEFKKSKGLLFEQDDSDNDGLVDWLEMAIGSDTKSADSDGDGIYDGKEVQLGCDPLRKDYLG